MMPMKEKTDSLQLIDPASPGPLLPDAGVPVVWIAAGIAALLVLLMILIRRKRKATSADPLAARKAAFTAALAALDDSGGYDVRCTAVQCSLILRKYLASAGNDPALFETHEEFISRHDALQALTPDARAAAESGFARLSALKYSPVLPPADAAAILTGSRALLETLHHGFNP